MHEMFNLSRYEISCNQNFSHVRTIALLPLPLVGMLIVPPPLGESYSSDYLRHYNYLIDYGGKQHLLTDLSFIASSQIIVHCIVKKAESVSDTRKHMWQCIYHSEPFDRPILMRL